MKFATQRRKRMPTESPIVFLRYARLTDGNPMSAGWSGKPLLKPPTKAVSFLLRKANICSNIYVSYCPGAMIHTAPWRVFIVPGRSL